MSRICCGVLFAMGVCALLACDDHDEFRSDVVLCEEAVSHLRSCCPNTAVQMFQCHYSLTTSSSSSSAADSTESSRYEEEDDGDDGWGGGCHTSEHKPDLTEPESRCLTDLSCDALAPTCASLAKSKTLGSTCQ